MEDVLTAIANHPWAFAGLVAGLIFVIATIRDGL